MSDAQLDACIARLDDDGDGRVALEELVEWTKRPSSMVDEEDIRFTRSLPAKNASVMTAKKCSPTSSSVARAPSSRAFA